MTPARAAVAIGVRRGWREYGQSLRSPQDVGFYLFTTMLAVGYVYLRRDSDVPATDITFPQFAVPSLLVGLVAFGLVIGVTYQLALEREDGTLLRSRAVPHGLTGYVVGQLVFQTLSLLPPMLVLLVPSMLLFDGVAPDGLQGWLTLVGVMALALLATLPIGMIVGSLVPNVQKVGTWGMAPFLFVTAISGVVAPVQSLWGWLQGVAQVFPLYWLGLGMRSAFLPDSAAAGELTGSWRPIPTVAVLAVWAVGGLVLAPRVLRRMASRQSGSSMAEAREAAAQWNR